MSSFSCSTEFRQSTTCSKTGTDHASQHILLFPYSSYSSTLFSTPNSFPLSSLAPTRVNYKAGNFRVFNPNSLFFLQSCVAWGSRFQTYYVKLASLFFSPRNFPSVQVLNLEKERKKDKKKGKGLSVPFPFLQLSLWECPRTCWLHVPGFWPQSLPEERKSQQLWVYLLMVPLLRVWRQSLGPKSSCPCNSVVSPYSWTNAELPLDFLQYTHSLFLPQVICLRVWKQYIYTTLNSVLWFPTCKMEVRLHTSF